MKLIKSISLLFVLSLLGFQSVVAQSSAGRGLGYVRSAWNLDPGYLIAYSHARFFGKVGNINISQSVASAVTFWDVQQGLGFNYGISKNFELELRPIIYQDNQHGDNGYNLIDDIFLALKIGSLGSTGGSIKYGIDVATRFPTAGIHNVAFEPYAAGKVSFGFNSRVSYSADPLYPDDGLSYHLNVGYWNHNDVGEQLTTVDPAIDSTRVTTPTQELTFGTGVVLPSDRFDFSFELYGNSFIQQPPITAYSRENYLYVSPRVRYKAYRWLALDTSVDLCVSSDKDETNYQFQGSFPDLPNYPAWRINIGARVIILPTSVHSTSERDLLMKKAETRRELFEQIIREQRETESAEDELERIKEERRKAERELERLRRILEGDASKKKNNGDNN